MVIVITGASSGIGAALAKRLSSKGHELVLSARREAQLNEVAKACAPAKVRVVVADVTRRADVERLRDEALKAFGRVDVWVSNAGRGISKKVLELSDADVDEMFAVNFKAYLYGAQAIVPHFQKNGRGHLVNVSSFLGRIPIATIRSAYSAAKAAMNSLMANLRMDLALSHPQIKVSVVSPGITLTDFGKNALGSAGPTPTFANANPAMKPQTADEVAAAIEREIEEPRLDTYTNPAQAEVWKRYAQDVPGWEREWVAHAKPQS